MRNLPKWKKIRVYDNNGQPIVPEHTIVRDGYYLDIFELDKLPKEDETKRPVELTFTRDDDYNLAKVQNLIEEARIKAIEEHNDCLSGQLKTAKDWLDLFQHRLTESGYRPIEQWYTNYQEFKTNEDN